MKCAGPHDTRKCSKTLDIPPTCANCKGQHPVNFSKCPALLAFLTKRNSRLAKTQHHNYTPSAPTTLGSQGMILKSQQYQNIANTPREIHKPVTPQFSCASIVAGQISPQKTPVSPEEGVHGILEEVKSFDLSTFLKIIELIRKYYVNCTNTMTK